MKRSFKLLLLSICVIIIGTSFVGCNKNYSEEISFFNYGENIDEETIKEFEKQYGIKVNVETFDDMETMYQKVSNSGVKYDVILVSDALMPRMIKNNLVQELNKDNIPNISQMDEDYLNLDIDPGNKYSVPYMFGTVGLIYNKDVVKEDVDSWDILWDEKYKNRIFMFDTYRDTLGAALKKLGYSLNSENQKEIEEAKELLLEQRKLTNPVYVVDEVKDNMITGEKMLAAVWSGDAIYIMNENPDMKYVIPEEGSNKWVDALCIPKDAPNKAGAEAFINFLCDPENAKENVDYIGYSTPNTAAYDLLDDETKNNPAAYPSDSILDKCVLFTNLNQETLKLYESAFTEVLSQ